MIMTTKTHAALASFFCLGACAVLFTKSIELVGVLHGPSAEIHALDRRSAVRKEIPNNCVEVWPWDDVIAPYRDRAYRDPRAHVLRDAGVVASLFSLLLATVPGATAVRYTAGQRLRLFALACPLYTLPGVVGQLCFQTTTPIEIDFLETCGPTKGLSYIAYCSMQSLFIGLELGGPYSMLALVHDLKVVITAEMFTYVVLGLGVPPRAN